jgi:Domain of unknown function (DUF4174)
MITKILFTLALAAGTTPVTPAQQTLAALTGRNRVLLVIAPDSTDRRFGQQLDNFAHHSADLGSRDLVLIPIVPDSGLPNASPVLRELRPPLVHDDEKITIRKRFHIDPASFVVILLDKSGAERLRSTTPITIQRLNRTIDALPARK